MTSSATRTAVTIGRETARAISTPISTDSSASTTMPTISAATLAR